MDKLFASDPLLLPHLLEVDAGATLNDLREAVTTLEDGRRIARRVLGGGHPISAAFERYLRNARAALLKRIKCEQGMGAVRAALDAMET